MCLPAPIFWAESAETDESIEDGTKNKIPIIFSTIPTAAESLSPRLFAIIVIIINETCIKPSCNEIGIPILRTFLKTFFCGLKSLLVSFTPLFLFSITVKDTTTLIAWDNTVPKAAPAGPIFKTPIKI